MNQERLLTNPLENPPAFLRLPQILKLIPIGASSWWRWVAQGKAPKGIKLGPKTTVWRAEDISAFMEQFKQEGGQ
jgi:predicted DNA-binding transcriptional regulator AlpA